MSRRASFALATAAVTLALLPACGGGGGQAGGSKTAGDVEDELAYDSGFQQCNGYKIDELATIYGSEKTAEAVAEAVAKSTPIGAGGTDKEASRKGCLAAIEATAKNK